MQKTAVIHQPEYFPWLGLLDKARHADVFVFLDSVSFDRSSLQHRAKVRHARSAAATTTWMTIPFVHHFPQRIDEVRIADERWAAKHMKTLEACYGRAARFDPVMNEVRALFAATRDATRLVEVSLASTHLLFRAFGVTPPLVLRSSDMNLDARQARKGDLVLAICKAVGATRYLAGRSGARYLDASELADNGVTLAVQSFETLANQPPGLSALDTWMRWGPVFP